MSLCNLKECIEVTLHHSHLGNIMFMMRSLEAAEYRHELTVKNIMSAQIQLAKIREAAKMDGVADEFEQQINRVNELLCSSVMQLKSHTPVPSWVLTVYARTTTAIAGELVTQIIEKAGALTCPSLMKALEEKFECDHDDSAAGDEQANVTVKGSM